MNDLDRMMNMERQKLANDYSGFGEEAFPNELRDLVNVENGLAELSRDAFEERFPEAEELLREEESGNRGTRPLLTLAHNVVAKEVEFLWKDRIPYQTGLLAGTQGLGKSLFMAYVASMITRDDVTHWPDGSPCPTGSVLWFSPEGGQGLTAHRFKHFGACLNRIGYYLGTTDGERDNENNYILKADAELTQVNPLQQAIHYMWYSTYNPVKLIVVDPVADFMGTHCDQHKAADVSRVLKGLDALCEQNQLTILLVSHLRKSGGDNAVYNVQGSNAFTSKSRFAYVLNLHPAQRRQELLEDAEAAAGSGDSGDSGVYGESEDDGGFEKFFDCDRSDAAESEVAEPEAAGKSASSKRLILSPVKMNDFYNPTSIDFRLHFNPIGFEAIDCFSPLSADSVLAELDKISLSARSGEKRKRKSTTDGRNKAFELFTLGKKPSEVVEKIGLSKASVYRWYNAYRALNGEVN